MTDKGAHGGRLRLAVLGRWLSALFLLAVSLFALRAILERELADASRTWVNRGLARGAVLALVLDRATLYGGTTQGVFRTRDGGTTWEQVLAQTAGKPLRAAAFGPGASLTLAAGGEEGLLLSHDEGATWRAPLPAEWRATVFGIGLSRDGGVYVGQDGAMLSSPDGGATWRRVQRGVPQSPFVTFSPHPQVPGRLLAGGDDGLFVSADAGATWAPVPGWPTDAQVRTLLRHPVNPAVVYAGASGQEVGGLLVSRDSGMSWERLGTTSLRSDHVNVVLVAGDALYVGTRGVADTESIGGVWVSRDQGRSWEQVKTKLSNTEVVSLVLDPGPPRVLYAGTEGGAVFRYTLDAWWVGVISWLPTLSLVEPLAVGAVLALLVLIFASLRRGASAARSRN